MMTESTADQAPKETPPDQETEGPAGSGTAAQPQEREEAAGDEAVSRSGFRWGLWLVLLLLIVGLPLTWFLLPEGTRQSVTDMLTKRPAQQKVAESGLPPTPAPRPAAPTVKPAPVVAPPPPPLSKPAPSFTTEPAATSQEVKALIATIEDLRGDIKSLQDEQAELRRGLRTRQQLDLRTRLRWIASAQSRFSQMTGFWQDIALLPMLTSDERALAIKMHQLAAEDSKKLRGWRNQLQRLAGTLPEPEHRDIIPKPENPAFSWLADKFHLRPAPTAEQQARSALRNRILDIEHALAVEVWPEPRAWRHLLADLREQFGDDAELGLPEHLDDIRKDAVAMRAKAAHWLEKL